MKSLHWFSILLACSPALVSAQNEQAAALRSGTKINAALESTLDARAAKPGDQVRAKVTKDIKQNHQTIVHKGDRLVGHITKVENDTKAKSGSQVGVAFDQLVRGDSTTQLNTVLTSILSAPGRQQSPIEAPPMDLPGPSAAGRSRSAPQASSASGGLVGGVTSTVDSTAGVAGSAAGTVGAGLGATANSAGSAISTPLSAIRVDTIVTGQQQAGGSSVLSTKNGNLVIESGTVLQFRVAGEAGVQDQNQKK